MSTHSKGGSDTGAAFVGLIGGGLFIGLILWGIVILTNRQFEGHAAGAKPAATTTH
jgi:hypothetical protein